MGSVFPVRVGCAQERAAKWGVSVDLCTNFTRSTRVSVAVAHRGVSLSVCFSVRQALHVSIAGEVHVLPRSTRGLPVEFCQSGVVPAYGQDPHFLNSGPPLRGESFRFTE